MTVRRLDRRQLLRGLGVSALLGTAGCGALPPLTAKDDATFGADALHALAAEPAPTIPETLPVAIEPAYLETLADMVRETLAPVPTPVTATAVPNGAIREDLNHLHDHVETDLAEARAAPSPYEALERYGRARSRATELATAWAVIDAGRTRADVADRATAIREAHGAFVDRWAYRGTDPVDATRLHAALEHRDRTATRLLDAGSTAHPAEPENALTIGELAGDLERARAAVDSAAYLYTRYTDETGGGDPVRGRLETAAETLAAAIERRGQGLPDVEPNEPTELVDRDISDTLAADVLSELYRELDPAATAPREALAADRPATAVMGTVSTLARLRAFDTVRERIETGATFPVETIDDVRRYRSAAVTALSSATDGLDAPALANLELAGLAGELRFVDRRLSRNDGQVPASTIDHEVGTYIEIAAIARAVPPSVAQVADELRSG